MPHTTDQCQTGIRMPDSNGDAKNLSKMGESKENEHVTSTHQVEDLSYVSTRLFATTPPASSTLATFTQSPQQTKFSLLSTPVSSISAVFESPEKTSPLSSFSSSHSTIPSQGRKTPIAELEDTSPSHKLLELEDTSEVATQTSKMSSQNTRGRQGTVRLLPISFGVQRGIACQKVV